MAQAAESGIGLRFSWREALSFHYACPFPVIEAERGMSHYLPGGIATLIDLALTKPGWVVEPNYLYYNGKASASASIPFAGIFNTGLNANIGAA